jgi:hypothetical protein
MVFTTTATRTFTVVDGAARADIYNPPGNTSQYFTGTDANGPFLSLNLQGRARDALGTTTLPAASYLFEWTTSRGDLQPGAPATGAQVLGTGAALPVKLYVPAADTQAQHVITLTLKDLSGNTLSTDSVLITVQNLI